MEEIKTLIKRFDSCIYDNCKDLSKKARKTVPLKEFLSNDRTLYTFTVWIISDTDRESVFAKSCKVRFPPTAPSESLKVIISTDSRCLLSKFDSTWIANINKAWTKHCDATSKNNAAPPASSTKKPSPSPSDASDMSSISTISSDDPNDSDKYATVASSSYDHLPNPMFYSNPMNQYGQQSNPMYSNPQQSNPYSNPLYNNPMYNMMFGGMNPYQQPPYGIPTPPPKPVPVAQTTSDDKLDLQLSCLEAKLGELQAVKQLAEKMHIEEKVRAARPLYEQENAALLTQLNSLESRINEYGLFKTSPSSDINDIAQFSNIEMQIKVCRV